MCWMILLMRTCISSATICINLYGCTFHSPASAPGSCSEKPMLAHVVRRLRMCGGLASLRHHFYCKLTHIYTQIQNNTIKNICYKNVCADLLSRYICIFIYVDKTCATDTHIMLSWIYIYICIYTRPYINKHSFISALKAQNTQYIIVNG